MSGNRAVVLALEARVRPRGTCGNAPTKRRTDRELLDQIAAGDREALRELYGLYHRRLVNFLLRCTRREDLVEEIINDTLYVVWTRAGDFRGDSQVSTWVFGIAYRTALRSLRRPGHQLQHAVPIEEELLSAPDELGAEQTREWLTQAMRYLPDVQRVTLDLAYRHGYSCEEIAQIMACPVNTVKTRMHHARAKLRTLLPILGGTQSASASLSNA